MQCDRPLMVLNSCKEHVTRFGCKPHVFPGRSGFKAKRETSASDRCYGIAIGMSSGANARTGSSRADAAAVGEEAFEDDSA